MFFIWENFKLQQKFFFVLFGTEQSEHIEKMKTREKDELNRFRHFVEERIDRISKDDKRKFIQFQPLDKVYRSVVWENFFFFIFPLENLTEIGSSLCETDMMLPK